MRDKRRPWADEEVATLKEGLRAGRTAREIAGELGRTPASVNGKIAAAGLPLRPSGEVHGPSETARLEPDYLSRLTEQRLRLLAVMCVGSPVDAELSGVKIRAHIISHDAALELSELCRVLAYCEQRKPSMDISCEAAHPDGWLVYTEEDGRGHGTHRAPTIAAVLAAAARSPQGPLP